jgi:hypothetical protein
MEGDPNGMPRLQAAFSALAWRHCRRLPGIAIQGCRLLGVSGHPSPAAEGQEGRLALAVSGSDRRVDCFPREGRDGSGGATCARSLVARVTPGSAVTTSERRWTPMAKTHNPGPARRDFGSRLPDRSVQPFQEREA